MNSVAVPSAVPAFTQVDLFVGLYSTLYDLIGEPPSDSGGSHVSSTESWVILSYSRGPIGGDGLSVMKEKMPFGYDKVFLFMDEYLFKKS